MLHPFEIDYWGSLQTEYAAGGRHIHLQIYVTTLSRVVFSRLNAAFGLFIQAGGTH